MGSFPFFSTQGFTMASNRGTANVYEAINDIPLNGDLTKENKTQNSAQAKMAIAESKEGKIVRIQLQREGKVIILEITPAPPAPRFNEPTVTPVAPNMDYY